MATNKVNMEVLDEVRVKNEPIDMTEEVEEKFSATEEFTNKLSIAFLNEESNQETSQARTSKSLSNKPKAK